MIGDVLLDFIEHSRFILLKSRFDG